MEDDLQIPPAKSPLLQPHRVHASPSGRLESLNLSLVQDPLDELEFLAPGGWDGPSGKGPDEDEEDLSGSDDDLDELDDFSLEDGTIEGVPSAPDRLEARSVHSSIGRIQPSQGCKYQTAEFAFVLLSLLRDKLAIPGWADLPLDTPSTLVKIHKISGALTNAVFFVSIPPTPIDITPLPPSALDPNDGSPTASALSSSAGPSTPMPTSPRRPMTILEQLEQSNGPLNDVTPSGTPRPYQSFSSHDDRLRERQHHRQPSSPPLLPVPAPPAHVVNFEAPTVLLRVYGPSSGALISRKTELHILHTLSSDYAIGPRVFGTFANGRVEEYFHSRAIVKEEMRDERISRWTARRMRELHGVPLETMIVPQDEPGRSGGASSRNSSASRSRSHDRNPNGIPTERRPSMPGQNNSSGLSTSSGSSVFSFGTSMYSLSSRGSSSSLATLNSELSSSFANSPLLLPRRQSSESSSGPKRRSRASIPRGKTTAHKLGVWDNITRWTREAKVVLKELDQLATLPGFDTFLSQSTPPAPTHLTGSTHIEPLSSASRTFAVREEINLPLFEQQVKLYRAYVRQWEKDQGRSRRVFAHNDTQYGNLLLLKPPAALEDATGDEDAERQLEQALRVPHHKIIVVDFEYAGANARGFDIANHFIEWQADYHHPTLSHSLFHHGKYPTKEQRYRFFRAYLGTDAGRDEDPLGAGSELPTGASNSGNGFVRDPSASPSVKAQTNEEVRLARLEGEVKLWSPSSHAMWAVWGIVQSKEDLLHRVDKWTRIHERRQRGVEALSLDDEEPDPVADFDYLSYALGRITLFRRELKELGIIA